MTLVGQLVADEAALDALRPEWDSLAVACSRPYCSPAWMLAWWKHAAPPGALLRVVAAFDGPRLAAIAPCWARRGRLGVSEYRMLGAGTAARLEPLARPGLEAEAATVFAAELAKATPRPRLVTFEEMAVGSPWPELLARAWAGRPRAAISRGYPISAPAVTLDHDSAGDWLGTKSSNFRQQVRRARKQLEAAGARFRLSTEGELGRDLEAFARLHHARWEQRGGSAALRPGVERMLEQAGGELLPAGRFRLWCLDADGETVGAHAFVAAGEEVSYWLGGFDERWAAQRPGLTTLVVAVEDALGRGAARLDLGPGEGDYKSRLADRDETLEHIQVVSPGPLAPLLAGLLTARRVLATGAAHLPRPVMLCARKVRRAVRAHNI